MTERRPWCSDEMGAELDDPINYERHTHVLASARSCEDLKPSALPYTAGLYADLPATYHTWT